MYINVNFEHDGVSLLHLNNAKAFLFLYFNFRTYLVVAPTKVRPNMDMKISATILKMEYDSFTVTAVVRRLLENNRYDEISSTQHTFTRVGTYDLTMRVS